jgi:hypothetical protein
MVPFSTRSELKSQCFASFLIPRFYGAVGELDAVIACKMEKIDVESAKSDEGIDLVQAMKFA